MQPFSMFSMVACTMAAAVPVGVSPVAKSGRDMIVSLLYQQPGIESSLYGCMTVLQYL
jgi:hypothetical protein